MARRRAASLSLRFGERLSVSWLNCNTFPCTSEFRWLLEKNGSSFKRGERQEGVCGAARRLIRSGETGYNGVAHDGEEGGMEGDSMLEHHASKTILTHERPASI
jgi:hypothetical protein